MNDPLVPVSLGLDAANGRDGTSALYLGVANALAVTITFPDGAGLSGASASLILSFDASLPASTWAGATVTARGKPVPPSTVGHVTQWTVTLTSTSQPVVVTFAGLVPPDTGASYTKLTLFATGLTGLQGDSRSQRLQLEHVPTSDADLEDVLALNWVQPDAAAHAAGEAWPIWVSTGEEKEIANTIALAIRNDHDAPVVLPGATGSPVFYVSFDTVANASDPGNFDALCTSDELNGVTGTVTDGQAAWSMTPKPDADGRWKLTPPADVLGPHQGVEITLAGIITYLPSFPTALYLSWRDVPGYRDGVTTLPLQKFPAPPTIVTFHGDNQVPITAGDQVVLTWETYGDRRPQPVRICLRDRPDVTIADQQPANGTYKVNPLVPTDYLLQLTDEAPTLPYTVVVAPVSAVLTVDRPGPYPPGAVVTVTAAIQHAQAYAIDPGIAGSTPLQGSTTVSHAVTLAVPTTVTVSATGYQGPVQQPLLLDLQAYLSTNGFCLAMDGGIWGLSSKGVLTQLAAVDPTAVTDICSVDGIVLWGDRTQSALSWRGPTSVGSQPLPAPAASICFNGPGAAGSMCSVLCSDGSVTVHNSGDLRGDFERIATVDSATIGSRMRAWSTVCYYTVPRGLWVFDIGGGLSPDFPTIGPALGGVAVTNDRASTIFWLDDVNHALVATPTDVWGHAGQNKTLCPATPTSNSGLAYDGQDLFWLEAGAGGGSDLWRYSTGGQNRTKLWETPQTAYALTVRDANTCLQPAGVPQLGSSFE